MILRPPSRPARREAGMATDALLIPPGPVTPATLRAVAARLRERWPTSGRVQAYAGWVREDLAQLARLIEMLAERMEQTAHDLHN